MQIVTVVNIKLHHVTDQNAIKNSQVLDAIFFTDYWKESDTFF